MPPRSKAPLSDIDVSVLRRIKSGITDPKLLPSRELAQMRKLALVEKLDGHMALTAQGQDRIDAIIASSR